MPCDSYLTLVPHLASVIVNKPSLHIYYAMTRRITKLSACISLSPEICIPNPEHAAHVGYPAGSICVAYCAREGTVAARKEAAAAARPSIVTLFVLRQRNIFICFAFLFFFHSRAWLLCGATGCFYPHPPHAVFNGGRLMMRKCRERREPQRTFKSVALYNSKRNKSFNVFVGIATVGLSS